MCTILVPAVKSPLKGPKRDHFLSKRDHFLSKKGPLFAKNSQKRGVDSIRSLLTKFSDWLVQKNSRQGNYKAFQALSGSDYFSDLVLEKAHGFDGVMLDWWHNEHPGASKTKVKKARRKIAEAIRNKMGKEFIILGNVNWHGNGDTHDLINGAWLELAKSKKVSSAYSCNEIAKIEKLIKYHDLNLSEPRIIAVNVRSKIGFVSLCHLCQIRYFPYSKI